jgi:Cof subfamily protein (haloacid dehalogenase superfamily)
MPFPYRLAAIDLDETLLGRDRAVSPRNAAALQRLATAGVRVVIASGRMFANTHCFCGPIGLQDPVISYNGALANWPSRHETIHHLQVPADVAREFVELAQVGGHNLNFYLDDRLYVERLTEWSDLYHSRTGSHFHPVGDLRQFQGAQPTKMIIVAAPATVSRLAGELAPRFAGRARLLVSEAEYLEILPLGVDKAMALEAVGRRLCIAPHEMLAVGDGANDVGMLRYAGLGVAVGNASPSAREAADRMTAPNYEDGVAAIIDQLFEEAGDGP